MTFHSISCRCGSLQGKLDTRGAVRAICYCKDCQAFAHVLASEQISSKVDAQDEQKVASHKTFAKAPNDVLDASGGTDIVATLPANVVFTQGRDRLVCMSLSPKGLYRWYSACCKTPIGNTPRDFKTSYIGLVSTCLTASDESMDQSFGPPKIHLNTKTAFENVPATPGASFIGVLKIMRNVIGARLGGGYRTNPFFDTTTGDPVVKPKVLNLKERRNLG